MRELHGLLLSNHGIVLQQIVDGKLWCFAMSGFDGGYSKEVHGRKEQRKIDSLSGYRKSAKAMGRDKVLIWTTVTKGGLWERVGSGDKGAEDMLSKRCLDPDRIQPQHFTVL